MGERRTWQQEWFRQLDATVVLRVGLDTSRGNVTDFLVQQEIYVDRRFRPIVRYDTAHGYAHRDLLDWEGRVIRKDPMTASTYAEAFEDALSDIDDNWPLYRDRYRYLRSKP